METVQCGSETACRGLRFCLSLRIVWGNCCGCIGNLQYSCGHSCCRR